MAYTLYAQRDPRWGAVKLGNSTSTLSGFGCVVCSIASMLSSFQALPTPPEVNDRLKRTHQFAGSMLDVNNVYYHGISGGRLSHLKESKDFPRAVPQSELDVLFGHLAQGQPAMILVDIAPGVAQPGLQTHFMCATSVSPDGEDVIVNDSWANVAMPLCEIKTPGGAWAYRSAKVSGLAGAMYRYNLFSIGGGW